jgi:REP element-mobilizing transposase RayT
MATARASLVDVDVTRWYHCISRCVRRAFLLADGSFDRRAWIEKRLEELAQIFAVAVGGFTIMDNHLHVLVRLNPEEAAGWSDEDVVRRWGRLHPPRNPRRQVVPVSEHWVREKLADRDWVAEARRRLQSLSWFMKCLKEPLARMANREENCRGAFFEERFQSIAVLDEEALLTTCVYVDLNPVAAGIEPTPESSRFTSIQQRAAHVESQGRTSDLAAARNGSVSGSSVSSGLEESLWLCPIEDRRGLDSTREGMFQGLSLGNYFLLVDLSGRLVREGKAMISVELAGILERLGCRSELWISRMEKLREGRWLGRFFAASREKLRDLARKLGVRHLVNLAGCPT